MNKEMIITKFVELSSKEQRSVIKQLENNYISKGNKPELIKDLIISKIVRNKSNKYLKFYVENISELDFNSLINCLYKLLYTNTKFKNFSRNKILDLFTPVHSSKVEEDKKTYRRHKISINNRISNITTNEEFNRIIKRNICNGSYLASYYPRIEIVIWKERFKPKNKDGVNLKIETIE